MRLQHNPVDMQTRRDAAQALMRKGYGRTSSAAVRNFQRRARIKVDGIVGPQTMRALQQRDLFTPSRRAAPHGLPSLSGHNTRPPSRPMQPSRPPSQPSQPPAGPTEPPAGPTEPPAGPTQPPAGPTPPPLGPTPPPAVLTQPPPVPQTPGTPQIGNVPAPGPGQRAELAPRSYNAQQKYDFYAQIVKNNGGTIDPNKPTVLGIRGMDINGQHHATGVSKRVDDTFVVLDPRSGTATEVPGITHPAQPRFEGHSTGFLAPGNYSTAPNPNGDHNGSTSWRIYESAAAARAGDDELPSVNRPSMNAVLFHRGVGGGVTSAGCMSFPDGPWQRFRGAILNANGSRGFNYTLVDAQR